MRDVFMAILIGLFLFLIGFVPIFIIAKAFSGSVCIGACVSLTLLLIAFFVYLVICGGSEDENTK